MARTVDDLGLILSLIAGVDGQDAGVVPVPLDDALAVDIESLRVAYFTAFEGALASVEVVEAVATVIRTLESYGIETRPACPPRIEESLPITRAYWARPESISLHRWRPWHPSTLNADEVERSIFEWDRLRRSFLRFMQEFDLIVCPAAPYPAPVRTESLDDDYIYTLPYSLTGYPCVVVRAGTSSDNLPIGVQLIARPWHDHVALAGARIVESELGGWQRPPL
jgi:amidase